jgi:hypothetical protein
MDIFFQWVSVTTAAVVGTAVAIAAGVWWLERRRRRHESRNSHAGPRDRAA